MGTRLFVDELEELPPNGHCTRLRIGHWTARREHRGDGEADRRRKLSLAWPETVRSSVSIHTFHVELSGGTATPSWKSRLFQEDSRPAEVCVPSARTHCWAALFAISLGVDSLVSFRSASEGRYRPDLKCFGPCTASHVARRAASSMISSLPSALRIFVVVDEAESSFIAEPMIPLVYKWFIHFLEK